MLEIGNALRRAGREDIILRSVIARSISHIYKKNIEIKSVYISGKKISVRTGSSIINSELSFLSESIKKESLERLSHIGISLPEDARFYFN